jgi:hypothetical protein
MTASQLPVPRTDRDHQRGGDRRVGHHRNIGPDQRRRQQPFRPLLEHFERQARAARALGRVVAQLHAVGADDAEFGSREKAFGDQADDHQQERDPDLPHIYAPSRLLTVGAGVPALAGRSGSTGSMTCVVADVPCTNSSLASVSGRATTSGNRSARARVIRLCSISPR